MGPRQRLVLWSSLAFVVALVFLTLSDGIASLFTGAPQPRIPELPKPLPIRFEPEEVDLGFQSVCQPPKVLSQAARVINDGTVPISVVHWSASCGCTSSDLPEQFTLEPGGTLEFSLSVEPWGVWGSKAQTIQTIVEAPGESVRPGPRITVTMEVGGSLHPVPGVVRRFLAGSMEGFDHDHGEMLIVSEDGAPFSVRSADPPCVECSESGPPPQWTLRWAWKDIDAWAGAGREPLSRDGRVIYAESGVWTRASLAVHTDRADCGSIYVTIINVGAELENDAE